MKEVLAHLHDVSIGYDTPLIEGINVEIAEGDVIAILGPSGIGKTTLLRTISGLIRPLSGEIELAIPSRGGLGYIPQRLGLVGNLSVRANVSMGARVRTSRWWPAVFPLPKEFEEDISKAMQHLGIEDLADQPVRILSGGQQRRVATARTMVQKPKLVLADEFLGELDDDNVEVVMNTVRATIRAQNSALIMVEHHEDLAKEVANRIWRIKDGKLIEEVAS